MFILNEKKKAIKDVYVKIAIRVVRNMIVDDWNRVKITFENLDKFNFPYLYEKSLFLPKK